MVELMKFTRDICRLLGIGGDDGLGEQDQMDDGEGAPDRRCDDDTCIPQQDTLSGEEGLSEEERNRRRAERRRAKRKRQKERKKMEKEERCEDAELEEEEGGGAPSESDSEEEHEESLALPRRNKQAPPLATAGNKSNPSARPPEEEPEWDVSSAFVANAASHVRPRGRSATGHGSRENKENEARGSQEESASPAKRRGASLTEQGIRLFKQGQYSQAVDMFTAAIHCDPRDHRFFGNRSYCYWCLELYPTALSDAQKSIQLAPDWPKGYFRKGSALMGLKRYTEAEAAMEQVLRLDKDCEEASSELFNCRVLQLMDRGFEEVQSVLLLEKFTTVQAALGTTLATRVMDHSSPLHPSGSPCPSLWVGNVTVDMTEKHIRDIFKTCGDIESIRVLHERFCAFVNFRNANMAARALEKLQGVELESSRLVIRYPDKWMQRSHSGLNNTSATHCPPASTGSRRPVDGDQCFFWRTTGCLYGDRCRFRHIPDQRGRDKKPWQP